MLEGYLHGGIPWWNVYIHDVNHSYERAGDEHVQYSVWDGQQRLD